MFPCVVGRVRGTWDHLLTETPPPTMVRVTKAHRIYAKGAPKSSLSCLHSLLLPPCLLFTTHAWEGDLCYLVRPTRPGTSKSGLGLHPLQSARKTERACVFGEGQGGRVWSVACVSLPV